MRDVSPQNDRELLQKYLSISGQVARQTSKKEFEPFFETCRRSWFGELNEDERRHIKNIDIIEMIVKNTAKSVCSCGGTYQKVCPNQS